MNISDKMVKVCELKYCAHGKAPFKLGMPILLQFITWRIVIFKALQVWDRVIHQFLHKAGSHAETKYLEVKKKGQTKTT